MILEVANNCYPDAKPDSNGAFRYGLGRVVRAFGVNIGAHFFQQRLHVWFGEEHNVIHAAKCGDELSAGIFIEDWAPGPFQMADARIGIHTHNENVAFTARTFKIANMSEVQSVEAAVGEDDPLAVTLMFREPHAQLIPRNDFGGAFAHGLGGSSGGLATDGLEKLFARNGSCAAFHHHQTAGDVGNVCGFQGRRSARERQRVRSENGVPRAGDVNGLIAAVNGDLCEAIVWLEKRSTVPSARGQHARARGYFDRWPCDARLRAPPRSAWRR